MKYISLLILYLFILKICQAENIGKYFYDLNDKYISYWADYDFFYDADNNNKKVKKVVIVMHGSSRTSKDYYAYMDSALYRVANEGLLQLDQVYILAPHFPLKEDLENKTTSDFFYWNNNKHNWRIGDKSVNPRFWFGKVSSFSVMDDLIRKIMDEFENLTHIVLIGHSAGGQFVNRYSVGNRVHDDVLEGEIGIRYIVANPASYMYVNDERAKTINNRPGFTTQLFSEEKSKYSYYKYGLRSLNAYMKKTGKETIRDNFKERTIVYLIGEDDTDIDDKKLDYKWDDTPSGNKQGINRFERCNIYYNYLQHYFGMDIVENNIKSIVTNCGHSAKGIFNSPSCNYFVFSDNNFVGNNYALEIYLKYSSQNNPITYKDDFKAYKNLYAGNISDFYRKDRNTIIATQVNIRFRAGENIYLQGKFIAQNGCEFKAYIKEFVGKEFIIMPDTVNNFSPEPKKAHKVSHVSDSNLYQNNVQTIVNYIEDSTTHGQENQKQKVGPGVFSIYPNPARDMVTIYNPYHTSELQVYSSLGKKLMSQKLRQGRNDIQLNHLVPGLYYFRIHAKSRIYNFNQVVVK